jgi:hypothetical protein
VIGLFGAVLLLQPLQYWFIGRFGAPYPALTMPAFGNSVPAGQPLALRRLEIVVDFARGEPAPLDAFTLMSSLPLSHRFRLVALHFGMTPRPDPSPGRAPISGVEARLRRLLPGLLARRALEAATTTHPATVAWLRTRMEEIFPDRDAVAVRFRWFEDEYQLDTGLTRRSRRLAGEREVRLS